MSDFIIFVQAKLLDISNWDFTQYNIVYIHDILDF